MAGSILNRWAQNKRCLLLERNYVLIKLIMVDNLTFILLIIYCYVRDVFFVVEFVDVLILLNVQTQ